MAGAYKYRPQYTQNTVGAGPDVSKKKTTEPACAECGLAPSGCTCGWREQIVLPREKTMTDAPRTLRELVEKWREFAKSYGDESWIGARAAKRDCADELEQAAAIPSQSTLERSVIDARLAEAKWWHQTGGAHKEHIARLKELEAARAAQRDRQGQE